MSLQFRAIVGCTMFLATAAPAQLTSVQSNIPAPVKPIKGDPKKVICEADTELGTRIPGNKVCMTAEQWAQRAKNDREWLERRQMETCAPSLEGGCGQAIPGAKAGTSGKTASPF